MGLFKNIGRKFEEFKKTSEEVASEGAEYECAECGKPLYTEHDECPDCGGTVVRETQADAAEGETGSSTEETEAATDEYEAEPFEADDEAESASTEPATDE